MKRCLWCMNLLGFYGPRDYCSFSCKAEHKRSLAWLRGGKS